MTLTTRRIATLQGEIRPPSDKSLTHRAYLLAAAARGKSVVRNPLRGEDCEATLRCVSQMGTTAGWSSENEVVLTPPAQWAQPGDDLYCGNSGTTIRLLSGLVASRRLNVVLTGDASLSRRPMKRIAEPLRLMGAKVEGDTPPLKIVGSPELQAIRYRSPVASGQIKSCILLAGLRAEGETWVAEPSLSRDHTERMLQALGVGVVYGEEVGAGEWRMANGEPDSPITLEATSQIAGSDSESLIANRQSLGGGNAVGIMGNASFDGFMFDVPGDISSAAFFMVAAAIVPEARITLHDVGLNPTRSGILEVFKQSGVPMVFGHGPARMGEPVACVDVGSADMLRPFDISGALVPRLIDEIPALAVLATQCDGVSRIHDARELRVKESDRIELIVEGLRAMGAEVETFDDGLDIGGPTRLHGAAIDSNGDHRIAMAFAIAGLIADGETSVEGAESIATSYPDFEKDLWSVAVV